MSRWLGLLSLGLAECPGELSRVSQVPFSSASFWQGLHFAVQNHLGESLHQCTYSLCPAGRGPALSLVLGVAGCNSRAGLCSIPALTGRATMSSVLRRAARGCASPRMSAPRTHAMSPSAIPHPFHSPDCDFACAALATRLRSTRSIFAYVVLAGSLFPRTIPLGPGLACWPLVSCMSVVK